MENAIEYFENEIYQYSIMLKGVLNPEYRTYVENKIKYYSIALKAIKNSKNEKVA